MDDFIKKVSTNKVVRGAMENKKVYQAKQSGTPPYSSAEMHKAMDCHQMQGTGVGGYHKSKMPSYDVYGKTVSVTHGHKEVGSKI